MARKASPKEFELKARLRLAHRSAREMSVYAGRLLQRIEQLERAVEARNLLIGQLKEQLADSEMLYVRCMKD
jgi:hypothetical protein